MRIRKMAPKFTEERWHQISKNIIHYYSNYITVNVAITNLYIK